MEISLIWRFFHRCGRPPYRSRKLPGRSGNMKKREWIFAAAVLFVLSGCGGKSETQTESKTEPKHEGEKEGGKKHADVKKSGQKHAEEKRRVKLSPEALKNADIKIAPAKLDALTDTI